MKLFRLKFCLLKIIVIYYLPIFVWQTSFLSRRHIMEGVYFPVSGAVIFCICLVINDHCMAYPALQTGCDDTIIKIAGERLTLESISSELPVGEGYSVLWRRAKFYVGRCHINGDPGRECYKFKEFRNDSRISLVQREGKTFQLLISNITIYDAGFYECGREHVVGNNSNFHSLYSVQVAVVPFTSPDISGNTMQCLHKKSS